jgi:hypothetical protein
MVKVSITLPNNAQITFESEEPEVIHEIVGMVLRDLPRELMQSSAHFNGNGGSQPASPTANGSLEATPESPQSESPFLVPPGASERASASQSTVAGPGKSPSNEDSAIKHQSIQRGLADAQQEFVAFCQNASPLGDMRRVVVAAEGASRFLGHQSVNAEELGRLFDLAGWQRPHSFVQTLRNAARSKFRWLERVPGRSGQYKVTDLGRTTAFSS